MIAININGQIKTFSTLPKTWGNILNYDKADPQIHYEDGFRELVFPTLAEGEKRGQLMYDSVNDVFTYEVVSKSTEELQAEQEAKKQAEAEKIKEAKIKAYVESVLTPEERLNYYPEWKQQAYPLKARVTYKLKTFENTVEGNTNAPDKGGWIEIK